MNRLRPPCSMAWTLPLRAARAHPQDHAHQPGHWARACLQPDSMGRVLLASLPDDEAAKPPRHPCPAAPPPTPPTDLPPCWNAFARRAPRGGAW